MPTAHRLSFPTCLSHPRSIHLHCHTVHRCFTSLTLGFSNRLDQNSQSSVAAIGPLPGVLTSSTHSLTWREFPTGLTTCLFNHNHLPHLERVLHTGLTTCFFNFCSSTRRTTTRLNKEQMMVTSHTQPRDCVATTTHSSNTHDIDNFRMLRLHRRRGSASRI
jgi:hypothetical protein